MITLKELSKLTGYSVTTVSRALNNHSDVNKETKEHIKSIATKNNYFPNRIAKSLVNQESRVIGFFFSNNYDESLMDSYTFKVFIKTVSEAEKYDYEIVMMNMNSSSNTLKSFDQLMNEKNFGGAIIQGFDSEDFFCKEAAASDKNVVFIDIGFKNKTTTYINSDIDKALEIGFEYLYSMGYKNILFVHGSNMSWITSVWLEGLKKIQATYKDKLDSIKLVNGQYMLEDTVPLVREERRFFEQPDVAVFCASDLMAIGIIQGLNELGKEMNRDVGILGYDGTIVSKYLTPSLSTIAQSPHEIGALAVKNLVALINGTYDEDEPHKKVDVELIIRDSTRR